jgi:hypothetical protein
MAIDPDGMDDIEPRSLGIPLRRKNRLGVAIAAAWILTAAIAWHVDASFAKAFVAAGVVVLPVASLYARSRGLWVTVLVLVYLAVSKSLLVPLLLRLMDRLLT